VCTTCVLAVIEIVCEEKCCCCYFLYSSHFNFFCVCESLCLNQHLVSELDSVCNTCVLGKQGCQAFLTRKT